MLGVEMYPSLPLGHQRLGDCCYRDREVPPPHVPLYPSSSCEVAARSLPPRLLAPATHEPSPKPQDNIKMELENASLWKQFSTIGTEMIITKKGRRMFPQLRVKLSGLNPTLRYILLLDIVPADSSRYRFQDDSWQVVGGAEARLPDRVFIHPDSPATGEHWQNRTISFHRTKLTNNTLDTQGYIILHSLHRYQPRLHVIEARDMLMWAGSRHSFTFPETQFLTVTAYQNNRITELKINSNPFAKGFRENGMNSKRQREARQKRKVPTQQTEPLDDLDIESCDPCDPCDPCDSTELLQQNPALSITSSTLSITDPSCGFHGDTPPFPGSNVSDQPISLGQAFITSQMTQMPDITDIPTSMGSGLQTTSQDDLNDSLIDRSDQMIDLQSFSAPFADSSQFSSLPHPQSSSSYSPVSSSVTSSIRPPPLPLPSSQLSPTSSSSDPSSLPPSCYASMLASSSSLPSSTSSPPVQLPGSVYPSISSSSSSKQLLPSSSSSSSSSAYSSAHSANHNPDVLSPHTPNSSSSSFTSTPSLPPHPFHSLHPMITSQNGGSQMIAAQSGGSQMIAPDSEGSQMIQTQNGGSQMIPVHSTPPAGQNPAGTAFPFPPLQPYPTPDPDPSTPNSLPSSAPLSAYQPSASTPAPNPITPQSVPNPAATAFPFPEHQPTTSTPGPNPPTAVFPFPAASGSDPNVPGSGPSPSHSHPSTAFPFPPAGSTGSHLAAAPGIPNPTHPNSFHSSIASMPTSVSMGIHPHVPPLSQSLPPAPGAVQAYPSLAPNPRQPSAPTSSLSFSSLPPSITPLHPSLQNSTPGIPNPAQIQPGYPSAFPTPSFSHNPASTSNPAQIPSCSMIPSQSFPALSLPSSAPGRHHSPSLPPASYPPYPPGPAPTAYPPVPPADMSTFPSTQFNPAAPYLPEMVLHSSLLPSIDPSLSSSATPALYPSFSSYPLRLCQDPRSSFHIPLRHIYRQPQHAHAHSQGSYLDMSGRAVF